MENLSYKLFSGESYNGLESYRDLKTIIFRDELQWNSLNLDNDNKVVLDDYDRQSHFALAEFKNRPVGVIRGIALCDGFPHRQFFERALGSSEMARALEKGFSINSLAVLPAFRNLEIGTNLLSRIQDFFREKGKNIGLLTAIRGQSDNFFQKQGYRAFGDDFQIQTPNVMLCNMMQSFN